MGIARRAEKAIAKRMRYYKRLAKRRESMTPPARGSLREGDICPCGCGGVMTYVDGVLTAVTADFVLPDGSMLRL